MISQRTKAALAAAKARGVRLGNPKGAAHLRDGCQVAARRSADVRRQRACSHDQAVADVVGELTNAGVTGCAAVARQLNARGIPASSGGAWSPGQLRVTLRRLHG